MVDSYAPTDRTKVRRRRDRGRYDRETVHAILDEGLVAHVAVTTDHGPRVIPTTFVRVDDTVYLHGSVANDTYRTAAGGVPVCVVVTLLDGLVLARSAFHHSMNYRSVVAYGTASEVDDVGEKRRAFDALVERMAPGRSGEARPPTEQELRKTILLALPLREVSAKVRTGGPIDDPEDMDLPVWAGVVPLDLVAGEPEPDVSDVSA